MDRSWDSDEFSSDLAGAEDRADFRYYGSVSGEFRVASRGLGLAGAKGPALGMSSDLPGRYVRKSWKHRSERRRHWQGSMFDFAVGQRDR